MRKRYRLNPKRFLFSFSEANAQCITIRLLPFPSVTISEFFTNLIRLDVWLIFRCWIRLWHNSRLNANEFDYTLPSGVPHAITRANARISTVWRYKRQSHRSVTFAWNDFDFRSSSTTYSPIVSWNRHIAQCLQLLINDARVIAIGITTRHSSPDIVARTSR